jgi:hypothetical protein
VWTQIAELALALAGHWSGTGKWLLGKPGDADRKLAARMVARHRGPGRADRRRGRDAGAGRRATLGRAEADEH